MTKGRPRPLMIGRGGLVCRCNKVYLNTIRTIAKSESEDQYIKVVAKTAATTGCGACCELVREIVNETVSEPA